MLLDLYHKMMWFWAKGAAVVKKSASGFEIPQVRLANGLYYTRFYYYVASDSATLMHIPRCIFNAPQQSMVSQTESVSMASSSSSVSVYCPYNHLLVGSGKTPVTAADYQMESEIVDGLTCDSVTSETNDETGEIIFRKSLRNTSSGDITINEVGFTVPFPVATTSAYQALVYREVLEESLVIAPGESATVVVTIKHPVLT